MMRCPMEEKKEALEGKPSGSKKIIIASAILGMILFLFGFAAFYLYALDKPAAKGKVQVTIPKEATGRDIADLLEQKGVIKSSATLRLFMRVLGDGKRLQSGTYTLHQGLSVKEAIEELKSGKADTVSITVPEGYTVHQIAELLKQQGVVCADTFEQEAATYGPLPYQYGPVAAMIKAEGFLFPDTYQITKEATARQILDMMYKHTDQVLTKEMRDQAAAKGLTLHDLFTLASMVEREAKFKEDQVPIASVMLKRIQVGMPLQIDATVQYVLGSPKAELTIADTKIQSPYNTYVNPGLPPGPIGAPGLSALKAVLAAQPGEYLYYVAKEDGHHVFTKTYDDHQTQTEQIYGYAAK